MISGWADMQSVHACAVQTHFSVLILFLKKKCAKKISNMLPFGHRLGTLGAQIPLLGRFWGTVKVNVFLEGSR